MFQGLSLDNRYDEEDWDGSYEIIILGSVIPKWFRHPSIWTEANTKEPSSLLCDEWMGIAICVVFCSLPRHQISHASPLSYKLIANGKKVSTTLGIKKKVPLFDHMWLTFLIHRYYKEDIKLLKECEANEFSQISLKIENCDSCLEVKKCGFHMVFKKHMEDLNKTMA